MVKVAFVLFLFAVAHVECRRPAPPISCDKTYEEYHCGPPCQVECATLGQKCEIHSDYCVDACYCVRGYARDDKGVCIPVDKCPNQKTYV